jgi:hypothetical protein
MPARYRAIAGDVYDAVLAGDVRPDGFVAVDVIVPGQRDPVTFSRARWLNGAGTRHRGRGAGRGLLRMGRGTMANQQKVKTHAYPVDAYRRQR